MSLLLPNAVDPEFAADEALIAVARETLTAGNRIRSERVCYYRTPQRRPDGGRHAQAGWIGWGDTQQSAKISKIARGYLPLMSGNQYRYGFIEAKRRDEDDDGPFELWGPWGVILSQRGGMAEFPVDQILTYHWYDAERLRQSLNGSIPPNIPVRNGMVLWPQLAGENLKIFSCPECNDWRHLEAVFLARHLRIWHSYDQADIMAFGAQHGVDFAAELNANGRVLKSVTFESADEAPDEAEAATPGFSFEVAQPERRGPGRPRKQQED
jgi:hypothetical protein